MGSFIDLPILEKCYELTDHQPDQQVFWQKSHFANDITLHPQQALSYHFHALVYFHEDSKELHVLQKGNHRTYSWNPRFERNCASEGSREAIPHEGKCQGPPDCNAAIMGVGVQRVANQKGKTHYRLCDTQVARDTPINLESKKILKEQRAHIADLALQDRLRHLMSHIPEKKKEKRQEIIGAIQKGGACRKALSPLSQETQALMAQIQCLLSDSKEACTDKDFTPLKKGLNPLAPKKEKPTRKKVAPAKSL